MRRSTWGAHLVATCVFASLLGVAPVAAAEEDPVFPPGTFGLFDCDTTIGVELLPYAPHPRHFSAPSNYDRPPGRTTDSDGETVYLVYARFSTTEPPDGPIDAGVGWWEHYPTLGPLLVPKGFSFDAETISGWYRSDDGEWFETGPTDSRATRWERIQAFLVPSQAPFAGRDLTFWARYDADTGLAGTRPIPICKDGTYPELHTGGHFRIPGVDEPIPLHPGVPDGTEFALVSPSVTATGSTATISSYVHYDSPEGDCLRDFTINSELLGTVCDGDLVAFDAEVPRGLAIGQRIVRHARVTGGSFAFGDGIDVQRAVSWGFVGVENQTHVVTSADEQFEQHRRDDKYADIVLDQRGAAVAEIVFNGLPVAKAAVVLLSIASLVGQALSDLMDPTYRLKRGDVLDASHIGMWVDGTPWDTETPSDSHYFLFLRIRRGSTTLADDLIDVGTLSQYLPLRDHLRTGAERSRPGDGWTEVVVRSPIDVVVYAGDESHGVDASGRAIQNVGSASTEPGAEPYRLVLWGAIPDDGWSLFATGRDHGPWTIEVSVNGGPSESLRGTASPGSVQAIRLSVDEGELVIEHEPFDVDCRRTQSQPFVDVPTTSYAFSHVGCIYQLGVTTGTSPTTFELQRAVTREQMAAFAARFYETVSGESCSGGDPFTDVPATSYARRSVGCLFSIGVTTGTSATTFSPDEPVSREQMAAFLARLLRTLDRESCPAEAHRFTDVDPHSFANDDISCIRALGITTGTSPTTFSPDDEVTREQMATFLGRLYLVITS